MAKGDRVVVRRRAEAHFDVYAVLGGQRVWIGAANVARAANELARSYAADKGLEDVRLWDEDVWRLLVESYGWWCDAAGAKQATWPPLCERYLDDAGCEACPLHGDWLCAHVPIKAMVDSDPQVLRETDKAYRAHVCRGMAEAISIRMREMQGAST